jgi:hypothetical protein
MQYDERLCLPVFLAHYSRFFPTDRIFIIDHGSSSDLVPPGYNVIRVPRTRPYSELSRVQLIRHFSAGLLEYFDGGIFVDCDELIDLAGFAARSPGGAAVTYCAGFDVFRQQTPQGPRLLGYLSPHLCKPSIFSITPNWALGFHGCDHPPTQLTQPMAHIRFAFGDLSSLRLRERIAVHRAMQASEQAEGVAAQWGDGDAELKSFERFIERRVQAGAPIHDFSPIDSSGMFRQIAVPQSGQPDQILYMPNGFSPLQDCFIDLTERFPALAVAGAVP